MTVSNYSYQSRKNFVDKLNKALKHQRRTWPALKEGEFVYYVKSLVGDRELKFVVASTREEAEFKAFPGAPPYELRSMPVHAQGENK